MPVPGAGCNILTILQTDFVFLVQKEPWPWAATFGNLLSVLWQTMWRRFPAHKVTVSCPGNRRLREPVGVDPHWMDGGFIRLTDNAAHQKRTRRDVAKIEAVFSD